jgi:transglutaminase-like putative cysteine protease
LIKLDVQHKTTYRFHQPVRLWPHRLMLRPRERRDLRLKSSNVIVTPDATLTWAQDVFGNTVTMAAFEGMSDHLVFEGLASIVLDAAAWPVFDIAASAISYPFRYSDDEWTDLGALAVRQYPDPEGGLQAWARAFVLGPATDTLSLLQHISTGIGEQISYESREDEGIQLPLQTLDRRCGSCRDLATLFAEAARQLGFGARLVSGYLYNPDQSAVGSDGAGSTHAWAEVYVPGAGWIAFDPTNRSIGGSNLIPVAVARDIRQTIPVSGTFTGPSGAFAGMDVKVVVSKLED